jgi:hypothetical protein
LEDPSDRGRVSRGADAAAAKAAKDAKAAAAAQLKATNASTKAMKDQAKLKKSQGILDVEQAGILAALQGKITENDKIRLELQLALLTNNSKEADRLSNELLLAQARTTGLATFIANLPKALNPFSDYPAYVQMALAELAKFKAAQDALSAQKRMPPTFAEYTNQMYGGHPTSVAPKASSQTPPTFLEYSQQMFGGHPTSGTIINNYTINGATTDLLNELQNGLINNSASGTQSSINRTKVG